MKIDLIKWHFRSGAKKPDIKIWTYYDFVGHTDREWRNQMIEFCFKKTHFLGETDISGKYSKLGNLTLYSRIRFSYWGKLAKEKKKKKESIS